MTVQGNNIAVTNGQIVFALLDEIRKGVNAKKIIITPRAFRDFTIILSTPTQKTNPQGLVVEGCFASDLIKYFEEVDITAPQNDFSHVIARNILAQITTPLGTASELRIDPKKIPNESTFLALIEKAKNITSSVEAMMGPMGG